FAPATAAAVEVRRCCHFRRRLIEFGQGLGDGGALAQPRMPSVQRRPWFRPEPVINRAVDHRRGRGVGPAEALAAEPVGVAQSPREPLLKPCRVTYRRRLQGFGEGTLGAAEPEQLAEAPVHGFVLGVANLLRHPRFGTASGSAGSSFGSGQRSSIYSRITVDSKI